MVRNSRGFTLIELLLVIAIIGILMSLAMANYHYARLQAAETSAISSLNAINQAQISYMHSCGNQKFAPSLTALGKPSPGTDTAFLSPDLTGADEILKSGYRIAMKTTEVTVPLLTCTGDTPADSYQVTADPVTPGVTGHLFFGTNRDLVVYENAAETFVGRMPDDGPPPDGQETRGIVR